MKQGLTPGIFAGEQILPDAKIELIEKSLFELQPAGVSVDELGDMLEAALVGTETDADLGIKVTVKATSVTAPVEPAPSLPVHSKEVSLGAAGLNIVLVNAGGEQLLLHRGTGEIRRLPELEEGFEWVLASTEEDDEDRRFFVAAFNATTAETVDWHWIEDRVSEYDKQCMQVTFVGYRAIAAASGAA
jgi:hypothetical protein